MSRACFPCRSDIKSKIKDYNISKSSSVDKLKSREVICSLAIIDLCLVSL